LTPLNALVYELKGPYLGSHSSFWNLLPPGMRESAKALDMLETLASERRELTLTEMGRAAGFAKPTAHRLAQVLVARLSRARRSQRSPPTRAQGVGARLLLVDAGSDGHLHRLHTWGHNTARRHLLLAAARIAEERLEPVALALLPFIAAETLLLFLIFMFPPLTERIPHISGY
jgi:IclR helix-turn-helix domain